MKVVLFLMVVCGIGYLLRDRLREKIVVWYWDRLLPEARFDTGSFVKIHDRLVFLEKGEAQGLFVVSFFDGTRDVYRVVVCEHGKFQEVAVTTYMQEQLDALASSEVSPALHKIGELGESGMVAEIQLRDNVGLEIFYSHEEGFYCSQLLQEESKEHDAA